MNIWRIHLKAEAQDEVDQRQLCLDKGIVGVGWKINIKNTPVTWNDYYEIAKDVYGDSCWWSALNAMKNRIQLDDLIWTRDLKGNYFLGRVISEWYYDTSEDCSAANIVNVRKCDWKKMGTETAVPGKVVSSFRPEKTVLRIEDDTVYYYSQIVYNQRIQKSFYQVDNQVGKDIFTLLSADGCEDAIAIYLQVVHNYLLIPSSSKDKSISFEFELKHRQTGKSAVVQVKSGWMPLNIDDYAKLDTNVFLFATSGQYNGTVKPNVQTIKPETIKKFLYEHIHLLPDKMKVWIELTRK